MKLAENKYKILNAEDMAISLYNDTIVEFSHLENSYKENVKDNLLNKLLIAKNALYNAYVFDNVPLNSLKTTIDYYNKVIKIVENF